MQTQLAIESKNNIKFTARDYEEKKDFEGTDSGTVSNMVSFVEQHSPRDNSKCMTKSMVSV